MVREISGLSVEDQSLSPDSSIISSTPIVDKQRRKRRKACLTTQGSKRRDLAGNERQREQKQEKLESDSWSLSTKSFILWINMYLKFIYKKSDGVKK